jgi:hypothetical protein
LRLLVPTLAWRKVIMATKFGSWSSLVLRSSRIAAQLMGVAFMRFVWKIEPLASMDDDDIVAAIAPTIQRYLDGDIRPAGL